MSRSYQIRSFALLGVAAAIALAAFLVSNATRRAEAQQEIFLDWGEGPENCP